MAPIARQDRPKRVGRLHQIRQRPCIEVRRKMRGWLRRHQETAPCVALDPSPFHKLRRLASHRLPGNTSGIAQRIGIAGFQVGQPIRILIIDATGALDSSARGVIVADIVMRDLPENDRQEKIAAESNANALEMPQQKLAHCRRDFLRMRLVIPQDNGRETFFLLRRGNILLRFVFAHFHMCRVLLQNQDNTLLHSNPFGNNETAHNVQSRPRRRRRNRLRVRRTATRPLSLLGIRKQDCSSIEGRCRRSIGVRVRFTGFRVPFFLG